MVPGEFRILRPIEGGEEFYTFIYKCSTLMVLLSGIVLNSLSCLNCHLLLVEQ